MGVALRILQNVFENLDSQFLFIVRLTVFLFFMLLFLNLIFVFGATANEPHSTGVAQFIIECHLSRLVAPLTSLSTLTPLTLYLLLLIILEETVIIYFIQFYLGQIFLKIPGLQSA